MPPLDKADQTHVSNIENVLHSKPGDTGAASKAFIDELHGLSNAEQLQIARQVQSDISQENKNTASYDQSHPDSMKAFLPELHITDGDDHYVTGDNPSRFTIDEETDSGRKTVYDTSAKKETVGDTVSSEWDNFARQSGIDQEGQEMSQTAKYYEHLWHSIPGKGTPDDHN